ncbi:MAG: PFL family protein [Clostridia bacterium]|nr:PFL family protein [Clostridia bacterium]MBQ7865122.1 PFL family protein [Clostridia bacterium]
MIETGEILQTMRMIQEENFDIRTITLGINLLDCSDPDGEKCGQRVYDKICRVAKDLVKTGEAIEREFSIPIVNKRISVTPVSLICQADPRPIARWLDKAAAEMGVNFLGGYSALMQKGATLADERLLASIPEVMATTERLCSSVNVGSTRAGINMNAVREMGEIIKKTAELTADRDSLGCAKLVVFANAVEDNPFMAGAFCGVGEPECAINVGVSGPGVVKKALEQVKGQPFDVVAETIKRTAFKITRVGQLVAREASQRLNIPFGIVDLSLAPTPARGDSVAHILTEMGLEMAGAPGTTAALALLNDAVKKGGVMASNHVGGLSGAFIPVSEDIGMIEAAACGALTLEKLEAMTCVCSVGLDMIAIPGDTSAAAISGIIADEAAIGMVNNKTTAVRVIPAAGKKAGDTVEFGGLLGFAPVMPVNTYNNADFIARGGRIPAPLHSLRN